MLRLITALAVATFALASLAAPVYARAAKEPAKTETKQPAPAPKKATLDLNTASADEPEFATFPESPIPHNAAPISKRLRFDRSFIFAYTPSIKVSPRSQYQRGVPCGSRHPKLDRRRPFRVYAVPCVSSRQGCVGEVPIAARLFGRKHQST